jgi:hypothetical protein
LANNRMSSPFTNDRNTMLLQMTHEFRAAHRLQSFQVNLLKKPSPINSIRSGSLSKNPPDQFKTKRRDLCHLINPTTAAAFSPSLKKGGWGDL